MLFKINKQEADVTCFMFLEAAEFLSSPLITALKTTTTFYSSANVCKPASLLNHEASVIIGVRNLGAVRAAFLTPRPRPPRRLGRNEASDGSSGNQLMEFVWRDELWQTHFHCVAFKRPIRAALWWKQNQSAEPGRYSAAVYCRMSAANRLLSAAGAAKGNVKETFHHYSMWFLYVSAENESGAESCFFIDPWQQHVDCRANEAHLLRGRRPMHN